MFRFNNLVKRLPKKPLLGLAVLALALVAAGGVHARPAHAYYATGTTLEVEFYGVVFDKIDDGLTNCGFFGCSTDTHAEVYGTMRTLTTAGGYDVRNLAQWPQQGSQPSWCKPAKDWFSVGVGPCFKDVTSDWPVWYTFGDTELCKAATPGGACTGGYTIHNNKMRMSYKPGDKINVAVTIMDYDSGSADDVICKANMWIDPLTQNIYSLPDLHSPWNGNGECRIWVKYNWV